MRARLALMLGLFAAACEQNVVLGSECPSQIGPCAQPESDPDTRSPGADSDELSDAESRPPSGDVTDGGMTGDGTAASDAAQKVDGSSAGDAAAPLFPAFRNPSFELIDGGMEGDLAASLTATRSPIEPWYACRGGMQVLSAATTSDGTEVGARDGKTFFADSFPAIALNLNGLAQELREPLRAGQRYAFEVDLWSENGAVITSPLVLQLAPVTVGDCLPIAPLLAVSKPIEPGDWRPTCISFTAPREVSTIMLWAGAPADFSNWGARMFVDNIRPATSCR